MYSRNSEKVGTTGVSLGEKISFNNGISSSVKLIPKSEFGIVKFEYSSRLRK